MGYEKIGIAPIGWTNDDLPELGGEISFEQCIDEMALAGYKGTEVGNKYPTDPLVLRSELAKRGLRVVNRWVSTFLISAPFEQTFEAFKQQIAFLKALGANVVGVSEQSYSIQGKDLPILEQNRYLMNDTEWDQLAIGLERLGEYSLSQGIDLTYHHHMGTVVESAEDTARLMDSTNPEMVSLLFDTGHFAMAGADPLAELKKHAARVKHVHLKDVRFNKLDQVKVQKQSFLQGVKEGIFTVPGDGNLGFKKIFKYLKEMGYARWLLVEAEQDPQKANPLDYARKAFAYIEENY
jgi:inosose dehydratase